MHSQLERFAHIRFHSSA